MKTLIEKLLYASRWVMAPVYLGLSALLIILAFKFFQEVYYIFPELLTMPEKNLILKILTLVDLTLVGSLVVMVMFSGYENFVSKINIDQDTEKLAWLGKMDSSSLKLKLSSSIVAISAVHLLKVYMEFKPEAEDTLAETKLMWLLIVHLGFVVSSLVMSYTYRMEHSANKGN